MNTPDSEDPKFIEIPEPTGWPIIAAFGLVLTTNPTAIVWSFAGLGMTLI
jgi:hypothetical protein